jgi:hypothetical protein
MSSCSPHNLTKRGSVEFVSSCSIVIATIHPCNKLERDSVRHLGSIQFATFCPWTLRAQAGVEPETFYYISSSNILL